MPEFKNIEQEEVYKFANKYVEDNLYEYSLSDLTNQLSFEVRLQFDFKQIYISMAGCSWGNRGDWHYYSIAWINNMNNLDMIHIKIFK